MSEEFYQERQKLAKKNYNRVHTFKDLTNILDKHTKLEEKYKNANNTL